MKIEKLIVIGTGGHARVVIDTAKMLGYNITGIIDINYKGNKEKIFDVSVIGGMLKIDEISPKQVSVFVAIGDNSKRSEYYLNLHSKGFSIPSLIHPTAIISDHISIGHGTFVNTAAIINAGSIIGENSIINTGSIIEHEVVIGNHCHICPGVKIGGRVKIGDSSFIGIGSSIIDKAKIGIKSTVGAGSVIINDIKPNSTVVGTPGVRIK